MRKEITKYVQQTMVTLRQKINFVKSFDCNFPKHEYLKSIETKDLIERVTQERLAIGKQPIESCENDFEVSNLVMRTPNLEGCGISIGNFESGWQELALNLNVF